MHTGADTTAVAAAIEAVWPTAGWHNLHVVVAVSGGADSVALLRALQTIKQQRGGEGRLVVAHFNHGLRGDAADADADWVAATCGQLNLPCEIGRPETRLASDSEESARDARYAFLGKTAEGHGARFVVTAHTADDQAETVLMRVLRGTGIAGLAGIPKQRQLTPTVTLVRPMLSVRREQVIAALQEQGQAYRTDATNANPRYTRNRVRHELLPRLREQFGPDVDASLIGLSQQAAETQSALESVARPLAEAAVELATDTTATRLTVDRQAFAGVAPVVVAEAVKLAWRDAGWPEQAMGRQHWRHIDRLVRTDDGPPALHLPGGVEGRRSADSVVLTRRG